MTNLTASDYVAGDLLARQSEIDRLRALNAELRQHLERCINELARLEAVYSKGFDSSALIIRADARAALAKAGA